MSFKICVMIITRCRPKMLFFCLENLLSAAHVSNCEIVFVVVDNDANGSARPIVEDFRARAPRQCITYVVEAEPSIPIARNRALDEAMSLSPDLCAFIDDDEFPDPAWLSELIKTYRDRRLDLFGGPVRVIPWNENINSWWQKLILDGVKFRYRLKEQRSANLSRSGQDDKITIVTSNWIVNCDWLKMSGLRFDKSLKFSGGSDALFFSKAKYLGAKTGWCMSAIVYESIPSSRLSFRYQFNRAHAQANSSFYRKYGTISIENTVINLLSCTFKLLSIFFLGFFFFVKPGPSVVQIARTLGWVSGRISAVLGSRSSFYRSTDGG